MLLRLYPLVFILLFLIGCAVQPVTRREPPPTPVHPEPAPPPALTPALTPAVKEDPFRVFPQKYRQQALEHERSQEPRKALFRWRIVRSFIPDDREALERIAALEEWMRGEAERHFQRGLDYFQGKSIHEAQKEFLNALAYNPDHAAALDYLKNRIPELDYILYETREGDTLRNIAKEIYQDPEKDFLVAFFGDLESGVALRPGKVIKLPVIGPEVVAKP